MQNIISNLKFHFLGEIIISQHECQKIQDFNQEFKILVNDAISFQLMIYQKHIINRKGYKHKIK